MATGATATAGVKRARADVQYAHLAAKRPRGAAALPCDVRALLGADGAPAARVELRARVVEALGADAAALGALRAIVGASILALLDLNAHAAGVASVLADFAARGASVVDLNIRSHAYCMGDKHAIARAFIGAHAAGEAALECHVLKYAVGTLFAQDCAVSLRVMSGGGVRDVLFADWCRKYQFCTGVGAGGAKPTPNVAIVTGEGGRIFLIPFAA